MSYPKTGFAYKICNILLSIKLNLEQSPIQGALGLIRSFMTERHFLFPWSFQENVTDCMAWIDFISNLPQRYNPV